MRVPHAPRAYPNDRQAGKGSLASFDQQALIAGSDDSQMAELHVITAINRTYSYLLGDWETAERLAEPAHGVQAILQAWRDIEAKKKTIRQALDQLEAVALMYKPS